MGDLHVSVGFAVACGSSACCVCLGVRFFAGVCSGEFVHLCLVGVVLRVDVLVCKSDGLDECTVEVIGVIVVREGVCFAVACGAGVCLDVCVLSDVLYLGEYVHLCLVHVVLCVGVLVCEGVVWMSLLLRWLVCLWCMWVYVLQLHVGLVYVWMCVLSQVFCIQVSVCICVWLVLYDGLVCIWMTVQLRWLVLWCLQMWMWWCSWV